MMDARLRSFIGKTKVVVAREELALVHVKGEFAGSLYSRLKPFAVVTKGRMSTLVCNVKDLSMVKVRRKVSKPYSLIVFDATLPFDLTGYLAALTAVLAEARIPILAFSDFYRDYLLVRKRHARKAAAVLRRFIRSCRR
ncbi:ACT domain-containing protein [Candidatus Woesearchaeota archaeon]|nr:ACT domain-containing protein [Candidatus Woesearchaeota archaeon]